jgi:hypothetical protein
VADTKSPERGAFNVSFIDDADDHGYRDDEDWVLNADDGDQRPWSRDPLEVEDLRDL